ncbi:MAG: hypothetical protein PUC00_12430 [Clostridiales bacterium]|nr:hypothetical protein [Clostridiales bacterium]
MKRFLSVAFCLTLLLGLLTPLCASASGAGWYVVDSQNPQGYCYLYSKPSDRDSVSRNLGPYENGSKVYVLEYYGGRDGNNNYCHVRTQSGKTGYMHDYALTRFYGNVWENVSEGWYVIRSKKPNGYCYLYSQPSSRDGVGYNKGRHENGEMVYVISYYGGQDGNSNYCYVRTLSNETGFIHDDALVPYDQQLDADGGWYVVSSSKPRGYCYLYSAASSRDSVSRNLGRYNNGEAVYVLEYRGGQDGSSNYCYVRTSDGQYGFMRDTALKRP